MLGGPGDLLVIPALEGGDWSCNGDCLRDPVSKIRWRSDWSNSQHHPRAPTRSTRGNTHYMQTQHIYMKMGFSRFINNFTAYIHWASKRHMLVFPIKSSEHGPLKFIEMYWVCTWVSILTWVAMFLRFWREFKCFLQFPIFNNLCHATFLIKGLIKRMMTWDWTITSLLSLTPWEI